MGAGIKTRGLDALLRKLDRLPKTGAKRAMRKAVRAGTTVLLKAVRQSTPKDEGVLRKMQASKVYGRALSFMGIIGADADKLNEKLDARPSNIDWLVEEGHTTPGGTFVPPSGYMSRASREAIPPAHAAYTAKLKAEIEREAAKA